MPKDRKLGLELEFAGLSLDDTAAVLATTLNGSVTKESRFVSAVDHELGKFQIEVDLTVLKDRSYLDLLQTLGVETREAVDRLEDFLESLASWAVPIEIVTPPLVLTRVGIMDELEKALRNAGAEGTAAKGHYAFGLHLNPEVPSLEPDSLLAHLRAFILLYDALIESVDVDPTRKVTSFAGAFPEGYAKIVLQNDYAPDLDVLIADYIEHNPTRNRALDMLPVFAHLRDDVLKRVSGNIAARPTFHYRLPNSRIDEAAWSWRIEWQRWLEIERLASNCDLTADLAVRYLEERLPFGINRKKEWRETLAGHGYFRETR